MKESTLKDILNSYEKRRDKAQSDLEQRILDVYAQIPRVKEIDNEISKIGLKLAKLVLLNPNDKDTILEEARNVFSNTIIPSTFYQYNSDNQ